jgi:protein-tyrosine-phosphatase
MKPGIRKFGLGIWGLGLGYFVFYTPYSGLTKALSLGLLPGMTGPLSGLVLLPASVMATVVTMLGFITAMGWWRHAGRREWFGVSVPFPGRFTFLSGLCTATIIGTTTLAFTFSGVSVVFILVLLRGGVLIIAPLVDAIFKRRVRWFSWSAMIVSLAALMVALGDVGGYKMTLIASLDIAAYLTAYFFKFQFMTRLAKSDDKDASLRYFVEEQIVATPALLLALALLALIGAGDGMMELRSGFTTFMVSDGVIPALLVGLFYAGLCVCTTFIFLDRRENTFCIPMHCGSSMLAGVAASFGLTLLFAQRLVSVPQLVSAGLIIVALLFLSPLHHFELYAGRFKRYLARIKLIRVTDVTDYAEQVLQPGSAEQVHLAERVFLFVCSGNTCRSVFAEIMGNREIEARFKMPIRSDQRSRARAFSAGLAAKPGAPMKPLAEQALRKLGVAARPHASRPLTEELVNQAEMIYCMTETHRLEVTRRFPSAAEKTLCLDPSGDIEEPTGIEPEPFIKCAARIQRLVELRLDEVGLGLRA